MVPKILMFGWELPPYNSGGLGVACSGLAKALAKYNLQIIFVLPKKVDIQSDYLKIVFADDSPSIKLKLINSLLSSYITSEKYHLARKKFDSPFYGGSLFDEVGRYAQKAQEIARQEDFDIIHAHDWLSFKASLGVKKISGKPLIVHVHATEFDRTGGNNINEYVYKIEKEGMANADSVIAVSNFTKNVIVNRYGIKAEKIEVVHNGVETNNNQSEKSVNSNLQKLKDAGNKIVLFVGRLTIQKGPEYFLRAAKKVLVRNPRVIFVIAGSGDMERQIIEEAAYLGIADKVIFTGFLRGEKLNQVYRAANLYVLSSVSEPFGITPLESLVNGTPVLISRQSGVSEVISHALRVDFWDIEEMADKILAVLEHQRLEECLAANGQEEVQKITWAEAAQKCFNIYSKLLCQNLH